MLHQLVASVEIDVMDFVLVATSWGTKFGGINAFNQDFAIALAGLAAEHRVFCIVADPTDRDFAEASAHRVQLVPIFGKQASERFDSSWLYDADEWLRKKSVRLDQPIWIGHDLISGASAIRGIDGHGGRLALLHHMSYIQYEDFKKSSSVGAEKKHREQQRLFQSENCDCFAIGPLLRDSCLSFGVDEVTQLIPGFHSGPTTRASDSNVTAIAFGRMDAASEAVKQGRLAVAAFGRAYKAGSADELSALLLRPRLYFVGLDGDANLTGENEIKNLADKYAGRPVNVIALAYDRSRDEVLNRLADSNLALMTSWHEGFGLTGWEAIAAEVPLIVSTQSGLYQLIRTLGEEGTDRVLAVDIQGSRSRTDSRFSKADITNVSELITSAARSMSLRKKKAIELKKLLTEKYGCTWRHTAETFVNAIARRRLTAKKTTPRALHILEPTNSTDHTPTTAFSIPVAFGARNSNPLPECAELLAGTTQGSTWSSFDILPELRFGQQELTVEDLSVAFGIKEAALQLELHQCTIAFGTRRLGDDSHPTVESKGNNTWRIMGPKREGILVTRALGEEPLCVARGTSPLQMPTVEMRLICRQRHISHEIVSSTNTPVTVNEQQLMSIFLNKCIGISDDQLITLSVSTLTASEKFDETD